MKPPPPPAWIMQPPPDWQTPLNGIISPSERGWSLCKNNWKEPRSILMSSADRVAHIDGQLMQLLWAIHTRFQRSINA
ncbi:Rz1 family lipoprotein [Mycoplasmopsis bovis]|uniref:Rz1 family lipoprotein n=1 Tax=Mycoplasmopsis bovis TaxID=28903 RepID=UPI003C2D882F